MAKTPREPAAKPEDVSKRTPSMSAGFALMSLVPILLSLYLMSQPGGSAEPLRGRQGIILGLMVAAAISGFLFIKSELGRTLRDVVAAASQNASGDLRNQLREISKGEISRIAGTIEQLAARFDNESEQAEGVRARLRLGLSRLAEALQASRDTARFVELFTEAAREAADAKTAYFVGVDEEAGDFVTLHATGAAAAEVQNRRIPLGEGVPGLAARERGPLLLHDLDSKGRAGLGLSVAPKSTIAAPLHVGESLQGVLILHDRAGADAFGEDDVTIIASLCTLGAGVMGERRAAQSLEESLDHLIRSFAEAIEGRDPYFRGHSARVAIYCEEIAKALKLDDETIRQLRWAAYLHGIGRVHLPETLLRREDRLSEDELEHVRSYPARGEEIIRDVPSLAAVAPMVRHHLERVDGQGRPDGIKGEDIPLTTHILMVANAFDAMTSDRAWRQANSLAEAFRRLQLGAGKLYDKRVVKALLEVDPKVLKTPTAARSDAEAVKGQGAASISVME